MQWPALRFERFYEAFLRRQIIEELTSRKISMINALFSNSNYDGDNAKIRDQVIERLEDQFNDALALLYGGKRSEDEEIDKDNPFFAAMDRGLKRQGVPTVDEMKHVDVVTNDPNSMMPEADVDQE